MDPSASKITDEYITQFKKDGYVVIENVLAHDEVAALKTSFMTFMDEKVRRFGIAPVKVLDGRDKVNENVKIDFRPEGGNHDLNRWNMHLPTCAQFINNRVLANPVILPLIEKLLGPGSVAFIIASDTPYPGSGFQNIHQDFPRFGLTLNIPLVDFTEDNAPLEVWPRSHVRNGVFHTNKVEHSAPEIKDLAKKIESKRLLITSGSAVIRDQRLVHRGTANLSSEPRPCLSIWYKNLDHYSIMGLTIPVPHRRVANRLAKLALWMREKGRGTPPAIQNQELLNLGNFFGRIVEETSASDRDYRRQFPRHLWDSLSPEAQQLMRYASIENESGPPRSIVGSGILALAGCFFFIQALLLIIVNRTPAKRLRS